MVRDKQEGTMSVRERVSRACSNSEERSMTVASSKVFGLDSGQLARDARRLRPST